MFPTIEIRNMTISQSVECPLTSKDTATLGGSLHTQNGTGGGSMSGAIRRIISNKSWAEVCSHLYFIYLLDYGFLPQNISEVGRKKTPAQTYKSSPSAITAI
jgi:hypothetical protein